MISEYLKQKYPELKEQKQNNGRTKWSKENFLAGFNKFFDDYGHYPTANEIDTFKYLPSSRQIERAYGGLVRLRKDLNLKITNFSIGKSRSKMCFLINERGGNAEREFEKILVNKFGEHFVHVEKIVGATKNRVDFYIYSQNYNFCIDVYHAKDFINLKKIINIKEKKYSNIKEDVYFINLNEDIGVTEEMLRGCISNKKNKISDNIKLITKNDFLELIKKFNPLKIES